MAVNLPQLFQTIIIGLLTVVLIAFLNLVTNLGDFLFRLSTLNNYTFKLLKSPDLAKMRFNNFGNIYYDWLIFCDLASSIETPKIL